jgi:hypothetical protein
MPGGLDCLQFYCCSDPNVFNLPNRKKDFTKLLGKVSELFLESTDSSVLSNCGLVLTSFAKSNHARTGEALLRLKEIAGSLRDRLLALFKDKLKLREGMDVDDEDASPRDIEHSISLSLRRLGLLSKRWDVAELLGDEDESDILIEQLCDPIGVDIAKELDARKAFRDGDKYVPVSEIWKSADSRVHAHVAETVKEALFFLLLCVGWRLKKELTLIDDPQHGTATDMKNHIVLCMRERLLRLTVLCFEQFLEEAHAESCSGEQLEFSTAVQECALAVRSDLLNLFPNDWNNAASPFLRACALESEIGMDGGSVRFLRNQMEKVSFLGLLSIGSVNYSNIVFSFFLYRSEPVGTRQSVA